MSAAPLWYTALMSTKVVISKKRYEELRHQASAWRRTVGAPADGVVFNAARDNAGRGVSVAKMIRVLRKLKREESC